MENIELDYKGNFTQKDFETKIIDAQNSLIINNNLNINSFRQIRYSHNIGITISNQTFSCQYITYEITQDENIIGYLNCLMNSENTFINISSHR